MKGFGRTGLLVLFALIAWSGSPSDLAAQCWNCSLELNDDGTVKDFGCSPSDAGGAVCTTNCEGSSCDCTPTGACGISVRELVGDGTVFVAEGSTGSIANVETEMGSVSVRSCNDEIVQRRYGTSAVQGKRGETSTVLIE